MSLTTAIAIYFIIWWTVLFAVLPWGVRSQEESGEESGTMTKGSDPGAPAVPHLKRKLLWNTVVSGVVFLAWYLIYTYRLVSIPDLAAFLGMPR
jgi:predicted secreted protein